METESHSGRRISLPVVSAPSNLKSERNRNLLLAQEIHLCTIQKTPISKFGDIHRGLSAERTGVGLGGIIEGVLFLGGEKKALNLLSKRYILDSDFWGKMTQVEGW